MSELKLFDGDVLLMTSDGVEDATAREILRCNGMNAQEIVTALGAKALAQRTGGRRDDITIIAAKIFLRVYFDFTFSMLLYKIYCAKYIKSSVEICANTRITTKTIANLFKKD